MKAPVLPVGAFVATIVILLTGPARAQEDGATVGPWRVGDMAYSTTLADDRPNDLSRQILARNYKPLVPEKILKGEKGVLSFRVSPRSEGWAGILILDQQNKPIPLSAGMTVAFSDPDGKPQAGKNWIGRDTKVLFSDASPVILPRTRITVSLKKGAELVDQAVVDFSQWTLEDSTIQMQAILEGPTSQHGFVQAKDGAFVRDGKPMFFWGGHENHVPIKSYSDTYAEAYSQAGINVMRHIGIDEILADPATGAIDKEKLDNFHYLIAKLGEKGIYFFITSGPSYAAPYGFVKGQQPEEGWSAGGPAHDFAFFWLDPRYRQAWKNLLRNVLTATNPYTGKAMKDDPTVIGFELANETGMNERRFDFNRLDHLQTTQRWREAFNQFLLKKYGSREALAEAWEKNPLRSHEDPAKNTILLPTNYRGARNPYGGTGQHDQYVTSRWYNNGFAIPVEANPRIRDAIEFNQQVAHKSYPFDFNNLAQPQESAALRVQFNEFLLKKYGSREALELAWAEDPLFPWETPGEAMKIDPKTKTRVPDPGKPGQTILIPSNFSGETAYTQKPDPRQADPRVGDAMEFTYSAQKEWASDVATFLKKEIGLKCGVGWNGDTFHVVQLPNHMANMNSPLDIAIAAAYLDTGNGDQLTSRTKNLKRFTGYGRIYGRPMFSYEWSIWSNQGPFVYEYALLAALMGREYGFDGYTHHKMSPEMYPVSDPIYSLSPKLGHYITPLTDRPRRGAFYLGQWIMQRSKIQEESDRILVGFPYDSAFMGGPERKMSNWAFENWITYQLGIEDYAFKDVYDGPADRVVIHSGHGPYGDYRKAKHAILWCHSDTGRDGKDPKAKEKWFALHGIKFQPGEKYFLNDQFFATTEDMSDYNVVHRKAEQARMRLLAQNEAKQQADLANTAGYVMSTVADDYWSAEPQSRPTELDRQIYAALKKWGYPLPFEEQEIDKVWRSRDRSMMMDTTRQRFVAQRGDMELWFGKAGSGTEVNLHALAAKTDEPQYAVALLPWDSGDFTTAKTLAVWCMWNSEITVKLPPGGGTPRPGGTPKIYAVNWLGKRIFGVAPIRVTEGELTFQSARHDDIFCYEIVR